MVLRAASSILRLSSGGMPKRKTAKPMTAMTPATAVKKDAAVIVRFVSSVDVSVLVRVSRGVMA